MLPEVPGSRIENVSQSVPTLGSCDISLESSVVDCSLVSVFSRGISLVFTTICCVVEPIANCVLTVVVPTCSVIGPRIVWPKPSFTKVILYVPVTIDELEGQHPGWHYRRYRVLDPYVWAVGGAGFFAFIGAFVSSRRRGTAATVPEATLDPGGSQ